MRPGMWVVGLWEPGYRCNGGTFFTNLLLDKFGAEIETLLNNQEAIDFVRKLTTPSLSYAKTLNRIMGWERNGRAGVPLANISGAAHITGGGLWTKFGEILPPDVGAYLHSMLPPAEVLLEAQEMSWSLSSSSKHLTDHQAYSTFHGGCGMILVTPSQRDAEIIIGETKKDGIFADIIGETRERKDMDSRIVVESQFHQGGTLYSKE